MTVLESGVIDFVVPVNKQGVTELIIVDQMPWAIEQSEHLVALQDKLNSYFAYVDEGQLFEDFPNARGRAIIFKIMALYSPNTNGENLLAHVRQALEEIGATLEFELRPMPSGSPSPAGQ